MQHGKATNMARRLILLAALGTVVLGSLRANAQGAAADTNAAAAAQQQYDADIAICNNAGSPAPERESCVRNAGLRLDRARGVPSVAEPQATTDGRATVMSPSTSSTTLRGSTVTTTGDGRATVVVPEPTATP